MAGVKGMKGGGGARPGAGGPPKPPRKWSEEDRKALDKALKAKKKETGLTWLEDLVNIAFEGKMETARLGAHKLIAEIKGSIVHQSETNVNAGGVLLLPMQDENPAEMDREADAVRADEVH